MKTTLYTVSKIILILIMLLSLTPIVKGQKINYKKNAIHGGFGSKLITNHVSLSYERLLIQKNRMKTKAKLNYGARIYDRQHYTYNEEVTKSFGSLSLVQLIGIVELNAGVAVRTFRFEEEFNNTPLDFTEEYYAAQTDVGIYGNVGLRFEKDDFVVRVGVGNIEFVYLGAGVTF